MSDRLAMLEAELARVMADRDHLSTALARATRFEDAVGAAPQAIACVSAEEGRYLFANPAYGRLLGRSVEQLMASDAYEIWVEGARPQDFAIEHEAAGRLARGEIDQFQLDRPYIVKDRAPHWVRSTVVASRDSAGRLACLTIYLRDIEEERAALVAKEEATARLQHAQKMEALGTLAGGVAHDFNNRLLIIIGCTELLKRELPGGSPLMDSADMVLSSAHRAAELTRQLLAYSRHQVLEPESFDLNQAVERMRPLLANLIGGRVRLSTSLQAESAVFSDPGQLEQVILNLAINARDAMPDGGVLTLATGERTVSQGEDVGVPPGNYVMLSITDSGVGIPEEVLARIFEPFFTTKPIGQGTGLGLSMVEGIVKQSRGAIRVNSRLGAGTTFTIYLPRGSDAPDPRSFKAIPGAPRVAPLETVLVCDDDEDVRRLLAEILRLRGYTILEARTGHHGLAIATEHAGPIHLLITDLVMPRLGGLDLAAEMRKRNPTLRVLFVSGYTEEADLLSEHLRPHARFLAKPFAPGDLTRAVFALLEEG
jgi:two-component system cell cycle sensor histidine kinase/response regulator CckA